MDEPKDKPPAPEPQSQSADEARAKVQVAERDRLSVVVVDAPAAQPEVLPQRDIRVPVETRTDFDQPPAKRRVPIWYWALVGLAVLLMAASYKKIYSRVIVRAEDGVARRVNGEVIPQAPQSVPHTWRQKASSWF